ncbi:MAG: hypothetical protein ACXU8U_12160, partial [Asticcacaulis sp.]
ADTFADIEKHAAQAADKDARLRKLMTGSSLLRHAITRAISASLHVDPLQTLADGWSTAQDIRAFKDAANPTGKPVVLRLGAHSIERDLKPALTIDLGAQKRFNLDIALALSGSFNGVEISILQGKLISVGTGTCAFSLCVKALGQQATQWKTLKSIVLPAEYRFLQPLSLY